MTTCLVLGGASCLWDDVSAFWNMHGRDPGGNVVAPKKPWDGVVACNDAVSEWPGSIDAAVSLHPEYFEGKGWLPTRRERGYPAPKRCFGHIEWQRPNRENPEWLEFTEYRFPGVEKSGSSGLFAAKVALIDLGFDRVVFCGVPLTVTPHIDGGEPWPFAENYRQVWLTLPAEYRNRMRSMSGWTRDYLGAPETSKETT